MNQKVYIKFKIRAGLLFGSLLLYLAPLQAQDLDRQSIVYRLYKEYAWEAIFSPTKGGLGVIDKPLLLQPKHELSKYFDQDLVALLSAEQKCTSELRGELCKLEFDPLFASQDPAAVDLKIEDMIGGKVSVEFVYPSTNQKIHLIYLVHKTSSGLRVADIEYVDAHTSLKKLLSR